MKKLIKDACSELNLEIDDYKIEQFLKYKKLIIEWNKKINLTSITEPKEIVLKHFIDCLTINKFLNFNEENIIDVGTGAGFPGLPIKIFNPNIKLTLLDALNKRINFLDIVIKQLDLKNVILKHSRAEDIAKDQDFREKFDFCLSRAVANLSVLAEYTLPFVKCGGSIICLKGPSVLQEIEIAKNAINILGGEIEDIKESKIPFSDIIHYIVFIKKIRQTPSKYPRKQNKIAKCPIN